ncbi:hypothetical protein [Streptomyces sp. NPDC020996]|uniref:hypothetical protein n=1 Tax=Streptomyces sp. NPDC020996 TaxID=3154791 RepID=UPI0033DCDAED
MRDGSGRLMSWLTLGEVPGPLTLAGGVLCLAGVAVSRSRARTARVAATEPVPVPEPEPVPEPAPEQARDSA